MSGRARGRARGRNRENENRQQPGAPAAPRQPQVPQPGQQQEEPRGAVGGVQPDAPQAGGRTAYRGTGREREELRGAVGGVQPDAPQAGGRAAYRGTGREQEELRGAVGGVQPDAPQAGGRAAYRGTGREQRAAGAERGEPEPPVEQMAGMAIGRGERQVARRERYMEPVFRRPEVQTKGTSGKAIELYANYFRLEQAPDWHVYQYHVDFNPPVESRRLKVALLFSHNELLGPTKAFDGMVLFLRIRLPDEETVQLARTSGPTSGRQRYDVATLYRCRPDVGPTFLAVWVSPALFSVTTEVFSQRTTDGANIRITITLTAELPPTSPQCLQVYGVIFRKILSKLNMRQIGRNYYNDDLAVRLPQHRLQVLPGFVESILLYENAPLLNLDISNKILQTETVLDVMYNIYNKHQTDQEFQEDFTRTMVGQIVMTRYNNKTYRVNDIDYDKNALSTFTKADGTVVTFKDYYQQQYGVTVSEDTQYLLVSRSKEKLLKGRQRENVLLVPEFCILTGLGDARNDFRVMRDLDKYMKPSPPARAQTLVEFVKQIRSNPDIQEELAGWDIQFSEDLVQLPARQVQKEPINMADKVEIKYDQRNAEWSQGMRGNKMIQSVDLTKWLILFFRPNGREAMDFVKTLQKVAPPLGMRIGQPTVLELADQRNDTYLGAIRANLKADTQLVMCVFPTEKKDRYDAVKKFTCCDHVVPSQVILHKTIRDIKKVMSVATKVAIQLNCKLGGEVWTVPIPIEGLMVIGMDVYHDTVKKGQSVAGFIASMNRMITRHYSRVIFQTAGEELVDKIVVCMRDALANYNKVNNALPRVIMVYRDGVGDGQLEAVANLEVPQFKRACQLVGGQDYRPMFAFIVVKKRINTRFFAKPDPQSGTGEKTNPEPGTVIDTVVTKREWYDFFMVSQSVRQGTVTPTHYNVIENSTTYLPDHIQRMTYKLCHLYYNWPGTIRVPAPCQYAHKLAYLVGQSIHRDPSIDLANRLYFL